MVQTNGDFGMFSSASSLPGTQGIQGLMAQQQIAVVASLEVAGDNPKVSVKKVDIGATRVKAQDKIDSDLEAIKASAISALEEAEKATSKVSDDDKATYSKYIELINRRIEAARLWLEKGTGAADDLFQIFYKDAIKPENVTTLPSPDFADIVEFHMLESTSANALQEATDPESLKKAVKDGSHRQPNSCQPHQQFTAVFFYFVRLPPEGLRQPARKF
jgi:hypothetical protein